jgi:hypothetical protein
MIRCISSFKKFELFCSESTLKKAHNQLFLKFYLIISDHVTLEQSPKRKKKYPLPMSQIEIDIDRSLRTQVFHVDLDKDIKE